MDIRKLYGQRTKEIIGDRTPAEEAYDAEVLRGLRAGADIRLAIASANAKHPAEALTVDDTNAGDVAAHYEYLLEHEKIMMSANSNLSASKSHSREKTMNKSDDDLAILQRIDGSDLDKTALIAISEKLDGIGKEKAASILKRLKKVGLIFGEVRAGKTYYALTVEGKELVHDLKNRAESNECGIPVQCKSGDTCLSCKRGTMLAFASNYPGKAGHFTCSDCGFEINTNVGEVCLDLMYGDKKKGDDSFESIRLVSIPSEQLEDVVRHIKANWDARKGGSPPTILKYEELSKQEQEGSDSGKWKPKNTLVLKKRTI